MKSINKLGVNYQGDHPKLIFDSLLQTTNFDVAIKEEKTSVAVVGRDDLRKFLLVWNEQLEHGNSLLGEAKVAWWCAIRCATREGY